MKKIKNALCKAVYRIVRFFVRIFYRKPTVYGAENLPQESAVLVGNHTQMNGPICAELFIPGQNTTWCAHQMMELREVPGYAFQDFWSKKPKWTHWFFRALSYLIAPLSVGIFTTARTIPVYRDTRLLSTFRQTIKALDDGTSVIIFPECYEPYNQIVYQFQDKYIDVARLYHKSTGKCLQFVPFYVAPRLHTICIGKPTTFRPDVPIEQERRRITEYLMTRITDLALALPPHTVIPYANISKKDYPVSRPKEDPVS